MTPSKQFWFACALTLAFGSGDVLLRGAQSATSSSPASNTVTAVLEYQEADYSVANSGVVVTTQSTPFKKEPAAVSGKIIRGVLKFGADSSNSIPILWQTGAGKLYLDLNRNHDLTDDPTGAFSTSSKGPMQLFPNIRVPLNTAAGQCQMLADLTLYDYGAQPMCFLSVRSFWQGKVTLQGRDWQVGIIQDVVNRPLNPRGSFENSRLLLRPWEDRSQPFNAYNGTLATVPFSQKLFVGGHAYQIECITRTQAGQFQPSLQFTEKSTELGEVKITGQYIQRLVLSGGSYMVVLDQPSGVVKIPTGIYNQPDVQLEQNGLRAVCRNLGQTQLGRRFSVEGTTPAVLNAGGPLTNSVAVSRHGQDMRMDYRLAGAGGETYQLLNLDTSKPPEFAVYKDARKIASGHFEFG